MTGYCAPTDLKMGDIPLPSYISAQAAVDDAKDEIDSYLGYIYVTPFDVAENGPLERPARLLLKRINSHLATGRTLLQIASPEENKNLHAYGWQLVKESLSALQSIVDGEVILEGAPLSENNTSGAPVSIPLINNLDPESNVEAFYDRLANPNYSYGYMPPMVDPDRFVL